MALGHPIDADCLSMWRLDESLSTANAIDATTFANHLVQYGNPAVTTGQINGARVSERGKGFGGKTSDPNYARYRTSNFTIAAWFYYDGSISGDGNTTRMIYALGDDHGIRIRLGTDYTGKAEFELYFTEGISVKLTTDARLSVGWHHLVGTWDGSYQRLWIDGANEKSDNSHSGSSIFFGSNSVGNYHSIGNVSYSDSMRNVPGYIDDVAHYSAVKSAAWILRYASQDETSPALSVVDPVENGVSASLTPEITFDVTDAGIGVDPASVIITINDETAYSGSAAMPGYSVTRSAISDGYRYAVTRALTFDGFETITVGVYALDLVGNILDDEYVFTAQPLRNLLEGDNDTEYCHEISNSKDLVVTTSKKLSRDTSLASRCRFRLTCKRGLWVHDANIGSQFYKLRTLKEAKRNAQKYAQEALQDLIDDNLIKSVEVDAIEQDYTNGTTNISVTIEQVDGERMVIGNLKVGS